MEGNTFLLPITEGCSHNACRFCNMYKGIAFRTLPMEQIEAYMKEASEYYHKNGVKLERIYLVGADPFVLSVERMKPITELIHSYEPNCKTITMYASISNIMTKSDEDLVALKNMGINDLYVGVENTLNDVLSYLNKGNSADEAKEQLLRLNKAGIRHLDMMMTGAAGKGRGEESGKSAAAFFQATKPAMIIYTTMSAFPGTELDKDVKDGKFELAKEKEILTEEKVLLENLEQPETFFWAAHALDSVKIEGNLNSRNREKMIRTLNHAIQTLDEDMFEKTFNRSSL